MKTARLPVALGALLLLSGLLAWPVQADIYKCVAPDGSMTYSNMRTRNCKLISGDSGGSGGGGSTYRSHPSGSAASSTYSASPSSPNGFPRVTGATQKARDDERRRILEEELANEQKALEQARKELAEQEAVRYGDERNYQKVLDRLQPFKDKVALHERNIEALRKEIGNIR